MRKLMIFVSFLIVLIIPLLLDYNNLTKNQDIYSIIENLETKTPILLKKYNIPGASIALIENGELRWIGTFGYADIEEKIEIHKDTVYQVASISKSVTALGIMKLVEDDILNLDDPIEKYIRRWQIPESTYNKNDVTIRRLLSHTAGLSRGGGYPGYEPSNKLPSLEESLSGIGGGSQPVELIYEPGSRYFYSGGGYNLLQLLIEEVTGKDFVTYMDETVLTPLGMEDSSFKWIEMLENRTAKPYNKNSELLPNYLFIEKAAAGFYTTIEDMSKFVITAISNYKEDNFLRQEMIREMYSPVLEVGGLEGFIYETTALGHFVSIDKNNRPLVAHDGGNKGWKANFSLAPNTGDGVVILTNGDNGTYLINEVLNSWYYKVFQDKRALDKLSHRVNATIYSISLVLILWSVLVLLQLYKALRMGKRGILDLKNKTQVLAKSAVSLALVYITYLLSIHLVPILTFLSPRIGKILVASIFIRVLVGIFQLFITKRGIVSV
ncbi:beta-lactamase class C/penicillin binding protein [Clostridium aceticum]|uniref:Beta-lactamase class C/penicillin binding protein n=1 Tax=Clostridium aceticum TaxID=84022 RepID=A0A0G3WGK1_9CLOT|nr:serine hydrolase domain-containing protein [Clostridium aceticum]AKL96579.1 beta-lactamase class C/penicillin binding protein [Clostridium aceticum]